MKMTAAHPKLSAKETGLIAQGFTLANRLLRQTTSGVTVDYNLGPRGAWIVRLIAGGKVIHPLDVTNFFEISRSVISDELARLLKSKLIVYRKSRRDGRRVELALTPLGENVSRRVRKEIGQLITERFAAYTREEVLSFGRMLDHFIFANAGNSALLPKGFGELAAPRNRKPSRKHTDSSS
jgi:DNA-binding MarR family transcriptional regulator